MPEHNGWTNYETWAVVAWIDNDESQSAILAELVQGTGELYEKADTLKDWILDDNPVDYKAGLYYDLLSASLDQVDWQEIIKNHAEDGRPNGSNPI